MARAPFCPPPSGHVPELHNPSPISLFRSRRGNLFFVRFLSFFQNRRLRYFGTFVRPRHNKWQYVKNVNAVRIDATRLVTIMLKFSGEFAKYSAKTSSSLQLHYKRNAYCKNKIIDYLQRYLNKIIIFNLENNKIDIYVYCVFPASNLVNLP